MANLATSTWPHIGHYDVVLIPLGSTEQHGPHLPFITDTAIAVAVAEASASALESLSVSAIVAPAIPIGASGEHQDFPGTISMGNEALRLVIIEIARSVKTWAPRVAFVNGHGGNVSALTEAVTQLVAEEHQAMWVACGVPGQDAHAGREETSLMLHIAPAQVDLSAVEMGETAPLRELLPRLRETGVRGVSSNGILGNPHGASAAEGVELLSRISGQVTKQIHAFVTDNA